MPTAMAAANCCSGADPTRAVPMRSTASPPTGFGRCLRGRLRSRCQVLGLRLRCWVSGLVLVLSLSVLSQSRVNQCFSAPDGGRARRQNIHETSGGEDARNFHLPDGTTLVTMHKSLSWL